MSNFTSEALRLANILETTPIEHLTPSTADRAGAELRRMNARINALEAELREARDGLQRKQEAPNSTAQESAYASLAKEYENVTYRPFHGGNLAGIAAAYDPYVMCWKNKGTAP